MISLLNNFQRDILLKLIVKKLYPKINAKHIKPMLTSVSESQMIQLDWLKYIRSMGGRYLFVLFNLTPMGQTSCSIRRCISFFIVSIPDLSPLS